MADESNNLEEQEAQGQDVQPEGTAAGHALDDLDRKVVEEFPGKVVRKDLTSLMKRAANVPTFVLEYLLGMYCSTEDPAAVEAGLDRIRRILAENYVRPDESEKIKSRIRELGRYTVIDKVSARLNEYEDFYVAQFSNLAIEPFVMPDEYVRMYSKMLTDGIWCIMSIEYLRPVDDEFDALGDVFDDEPRRRTKRATKKKRGPEDSPFQVASLKPIQMPNLDLDDIVGKRCRFTADEWERLLLRSAGYEPAALSERQRLHFVERMVPLVERNYNLCELGPRGTGKSHIYKEVSPYAVLLSGGQTTTANLFGFMYKRRGSEVGGLVSHWDCVTFDEVAGMRFKDANAIQVMKDYMASGSFTRGRDQINADASLVFEGNINDSVDEVLKVSHLFDPFPPEFNDDSAFFDRIHCYLPGWEVPKMRTDLLTGHYGLITDCLAEFCREMRREDFSHLLDEYFRLNADFTKRDETAVRKTFSGMAKLLYPDGHMDKEDVLRILEYAIEGRRRVKEQLKIMAGTEFMDVNLGYIDRDDPGSPAVVYVPEQAQGTLIPDAPGEAGFVYGVGHALGGEWAVYRLENRAIAGNGAFDIEGAAGSRAVKDSLEAAFKCFETMGSRTAAGMRIDEKDFRLFVNDLQGRGPSAEVSLAEFVGLCSAACRRPVEPSLAIPGTLRLSGTMDELRGLEDAMRVAENAGARRILLPMSAMDDFTKVPQALISKLDPLFYGDGDPVAAARKALGL